MAIVKRKTFVSFFLLRSPFVSAYFNISMPTKLPHGGAADGSSTARRGHQERGREEHQKKIGLGSFELLILRQARPMGEGRQCDARGPMALGAHEYTYM